jgi:hypothetical protein
MKMKKYFSFGVGHHHIINEVVFDTDVLVEIEEKEGVCARDIMFFVFGPKWSFEYTEKPSMEHFPAGIIKLRDVLITSQESFHE